MARHHRGHAHPAATTRSLALRILSTIALILPLLLLIISFSLALAAIYSPQWAVQDIYDQNDSRTRFHNYRAPFYTCNQTDVISEDIEVAGPKSTCTRTHGIGPRGFAECERDHPKDDHQCQQSVVAANLMVAGVVLVGIAMAVSAAVLGTGIKAALAVSVDAEQGKLGNAPHEAGGGGGDGSVETVSWTSGLDAAALLLALLGSAALLLGQVVGVNAIVNDALPNANFQEFQPNSPGNALNYTSWYMGKASLIFISVSWLAGFLAAFVLGYV